MTGVDAVQGGFLVAVNQALKTLKKSLRRASFRVRFPLDNRTR